MDRSSYIRKRFLGSATDVRDKFRPFWRRLSPAHIGPPHIGPLCAEQRTPKTPTTNMVKLIKNEYGRDLAAAQFIPSGSVILREMPYASSLHLEHRGQICETCFYIVNEEE